MLPRRPMQGKTENPPAPTANPGKPKMTIQTPLDTYRHKVQPDWIDHNGHMNMGYYLVVFDFATDDLFDFVGLTREHRERENVTTFSLEGHITYQREVLLDAPLRFTTRLLDFDAKRVHYIHEMYHADEGFLAATNELMSLHVSEETRRAAPMTQAILERLAAVKAAHGELPPSPHVGRIIGLKAKPTTN
jgi:acyl-CoA thioester hydrolase